MDCLPTGSNKTKSQAGKIGRIESDVLYTSLMERFEYGNMNSPEVYLDETNLRLVMNIEIPHVR